MARKDESANSQKPVLTWRFGVRVLIATVVLFAFGYVWNKTERFLIRDARFAVALPDYGLESSSVEVTGLQHASRVQVLRVFASDFGRSLYLLPLAERREELSRVEWVKNAAVSRLWPNRISVQIQEREPAAFVNLPAAQSGVRRIALIDADGTILESPAHARFTLPVARGISEDESIVDRRGRVRRLMTLMKEIGPLGERVSEVDVSDLENLKVTTNVDRRAVVLQLGDHNFEKRMQNFVSHYSHIQERLSNARVLDLRLEDRITVVERAGRDE